MKNLITAVTAKYRNQLNEFISTINQLDSFNHWQYSELLPKGKNISQWDIASQKAYYIKRKEAQINKMIEREVSQIKAIEAAPVLTDVRIDVEWKRNRTWGANPSAEGWSTDGYFSSGSIGGCGYDKESTAVAKVLNQSNAVLKLLYAIKNEQPDAKNHDLFGYGSGYGLLPSIEGGVGVSCYPRIFEKLGYKFETVASGKSFTAYRITKL